MKGRLTDKIRIQHILDAISETELSHKFKLRRFHC